MSPTHEYISKRTLSCLSLSPPPPPLSFYFTSRDDVWWSCHHFHHCTSSSPSSHFSPTPSHISLSPSLTSTCGNSSLCQTQFCFSELVPYSVGQQYQPHQKSLSRSGILMFFLLLQQNSVNRKRILINKDHFSLTRDQAGTQIIEQSRRSPNSSAIQVSCLVLWLQVAHLKEMVLINQIKNKIQNLKKRERDCFFCTVKIGPSSCLSRLSDFHCTSKENISLVLPEGGGRGQRKACIIFAGCVWRGGERGEEMEFFFLSLLVPEPCREGWWEKEEREEKGPSITSCCCLPSLPLYPQEARLEKKKMLFSPRAKSFAKHVVMPRKKKGPASVRLWSQQVWRVGGQR